MKPASHLQYNIDVEAEHGGEGPVYVTVRATPPAHVVKNSVYAIAFDARACPPSSDKYRRDRYRLERKGGNEWHGAIPYPGYPFSVLAEAEFEVMPDDESCIKRKIVGVMHEPGTISSQRPMIRTTACQCVIEKPPPCDVQTGPDGAPRIKVRVKATPALDVIPDVCAIATHTHPPPVPTEPLTQATSNPDFWEGWVPYPGNGTVHVGAQAEFLVDAETSVIKKHIISVTCS